MYAVIENGGKQYRVTPGETVQLETLAGEIGAQVEFNRVLAVVDDGRRENGRGGGWGCGPGHDYGA